MSRVLLFFAASMILFGMVLHVRPLFGYKPWPRWRTRDGYDLFWTFYWCVALLLVCAGSAAA